MFKSINTSKSKVIYNSSTTTSFHSRVLNWFNEMHNTLISLANYELLYLEYRVGRIIANERNLDCIEFTTKVNYRLRIENQISGIS